MKKALFLIMMTIFCGQKVYAQDYYVSSSGGDDSNPGTMEKPWKTIGKVNSFQFSDGDAVRFKRGDVFEDNSLTLKGIKSSVTGLVVGDYGSGNKPFFDGNKIRPVVIDDIDVSDLEIRNIDFSGMDAGDYNGNVYIEGVDGLTLDGIYINGHKGTKEFPMSLAVKLVKIDGDIVVKNCEIFNFIHPDGLDVWGDNDVHALYISYSTDIPAPDGGKRSGSVLIHDNSFHDVVADCVQFKGIAGPNNKVYQNEMYSFGENAIDFKNSANFEIYKNNFRRNDYGMGGTGGGRSSVSVHYHSSNYGPYTDNFTIRENYFGTSDYTGLSLSSRGKNIKVHNNYFKDNLNSLVLRGQTNVDVYDNIFECKNRNNNDLNDYKIIRVFNNNNNLRLFNNTLYDASEKMEYGIYLEKGEGSNILVANNVIFLNKKSSPNYGIYIYGTGEAPSVKNNDIYNLNDSRRIFVNGVEYDLSGESAFNNSSSLNDGNIFINPKFEDPAKGNFNPLENSPLINRGISLTGSVDEDYFGVSRPQGSAWDIGAIEYDGKDPSPVIDQAYLEQARSSFLSEDNILTEYDLNEDESFSYADLIEMTKISYGN